MDNQQTRDIIDVLAFRADESGIETLNADERVVVLAWGARGVIGNGGFKYFFEGSTDLGTVAEAFRCLGLDAVAEVCDDVQRSVFAGGRTPSSEKERDAALAMVDWRQFDDKEDVVFELSWDDLLGAIARYIEAHASAFGSRARQ